MRSVVGLVQSVRRSRSRSFNFLLYGGAGGGGPVFAFIFTVLFLSFFLVEFPKSLDKTVPACTPGQAFSSRASTWQEGSSTKKDGSLLCSCLDRIGAFPCCPAQPLSSVPPEEHRFATDHPQVWETNGSLNLVPICKVPVGCMHGVMPSMLLSSNGFNIDMRSSTGNWIGSWERCRHQITRGRQERIPIRQGLRKGAEGDS